MSGQNKPSDPGQGSWSEPNRDVAHHQSPAVAPGTGEAVCPDCGGTGKLANGEVCDTCDGNGVVVPVGGA